MAVSYSLTEAAAAVGVSKDIIQRAVRAGDLLVRYPRVDGKPISKPLVPADELQRWVAAGATERDPGAA